MEERRTALVSEFHTGGRVAKEGALRQASIGRVIVGVDNLVRESTNCARFTYNADRTSLGSI